jgi:hypothetical protein
VLLALLAVGALIMAAGASAATVRIGITGTVTTGAADPATIAVSGVAGDLAGGNPTGAVTVTFPTPPPGASTNVFHPDISQGCVRVQGNQAVVVGPLPAGEQFTWPGFGLIDKAGTFLEDNGVAGASPVDRASGVIFMSTSAPCTAPGIWTSVANALQSLDSGDSTFGYTDQLDAFPSNPDTNVTVVNPNGLPVAITDRLPDPEGLEVNVGAGSGSAELSACGLQVFAAANGQYVATCASLILEVVAGSAEVVLADGVAVSIPDDGKAEIADNGDGGFTVKNQGSEPIAVTVDGVEATIDLGETSTLQAWDFQGFLQPLDNMPTLNSMKAGAAVPLKWRVLDASGASVTDVASATIAVSGLDCTTGEGTDEIELGASAGSGLQNLGNGYYQLNWKTLKSYAGSCKTMHLDIGDGVTHDAFFKFK